MKKIIMTAALVACAAVVVAQTVTSVNIVGYNKVELNAGLQINSVQFDIGTNVNPVTLYGDALPVGAVIYTYDGVYASATYSEFFGSSFWSDSTLNLEEGSHWLSMPEGVSTNIIAGEVLLAETVTNSIVPGLQLIAWPYPTAVRVVDLGYDATVGDVVWTYENGVGYASSTYSEFFGSFFWSDENLTVPIGSGFWYNSLSVTTNEWIVVRPFTP